MESSSLGCVQQHAVRHRVGWCRVLFLASLCTAAAVLGYMAYHYMQDAEEDLATSQFEALADRALTDAVSIFREMRLSLSSLATMLGQWQPNATDYPFVTFPGFVEIAEDLHQAAGGERMGWVPLVSTDQLPQWEEFALAHFERERQPPWPHQVWSINATTGQPYHDDANAGSQWNATYPHLKAPLFHAEDPTNVLLMLNFLADEHRGGRALEGILDCVQEHRAAGTLERSTCGTTTPMAVYSATDVGPGAGLFVPVFPRHNPDTLTGFVGGTVLFDKVLENAFAETVSGIEYVLSTNRPQATFTYQVVDGIAHPVGYSSPVQDDAMSSSSRPLGRCRYLTQGPDYGGKNSTDYKLCLYPTPDFLNTYSTSNPRTASILAVLVIFVTSLFFWCYDLLVRREFSHKKELLEAKRRFMRFVSHEVRTPLNSVCMGLAGECVCERGRTLL